MRKIKYLLTSIVMSMSAASALSGELSETGQFLDGFAAVVNDGVVLKSELNRQADLIIQRATEQGIELPPEHIQMEQVLERLIVEESQMQRADKIGIQISDQMLNTAIARIADQAGLSFEELPQILAQDGVDYGE